MGDIKLFRIADEVIELKGTSFHFEKSLQKLLEDNLETFLGVKFLASEYKTSKKHQGRIDTLGIDENDYPVIIEYKRSINENVINQGLYYLDWLLDHQSDFKLLVMEKLGKQQADNIEWSNPRLLCIAGDFTKYDSYAVEQIDRTIELIRYRYYKDGLLLLELINVSQTQNKQATNISNIEELLAKASDDLRDHFASLKAFLVDLGDDVQMSTLKHYFAFKRLKNFACVEITLKSEKMRVYTKVDPASITLEKGFTRDVSQIGHFGTGSLEITIKSDADFEKAKPLLLQSYELS